MTLNIVLDKLFVFPHSCFVARKFGKKLVFVGTGGNIDLAGSIVLPLSCHPTRKWSKETDLRTPSAEGVLKDLPQGEWSFRLKSENAPPFLGILKDLFREKGP